MASSVIRCPVCLTSQLFPSDTPADKTIHCGNCSKNFLFSDSLPADIVSKDAMNSDQAGEVEPVLTGTTATAGNAVSTHFTIEDAGPAVNPYIVWALGLLICLPLVWFVRDWVREMRGLQFLKLYFFLFLFIWFAVIGLRSYLKGNNQTTVLGFLCYEAIGFFRYIDASEAGMSRFDYMFMMMGVGGVLLFLRAEYFESSGSGSSSGCSSCSSSSCSSCSGCGGGGGCGGCG